MATDGAAAIVGASCVVIAVSGGGSAAEPSRTRGGGPNTDNQTPSCNSQIHRETMTMHRERRRRSGSQRQRLPRMLAAAAAACLPAAVECSGAESALFRDDALVSQQPRRAQNLVPNQVTSAGTLSTNCDDLSYITGPMYEADADGNGFLSQDEYVTFTDAISGGYLTDMGWDKYGFTGMPLSLQETYLVISCSCELFPNQPWGGEGCCTGDSNTGIRTDGTAPGEEPDEVQELYLTYVCGTMSESLDNVGAEIVAPPTAKPTAMPTPQPTNKPTLKPTLPPPTPPPTTKRPTMPPVEPGAPTFAPVTKFPTEIPTPKPAVPTPSPTKQATPSPVAGDAPTTKPTPQPVDVAPTQKPTTAAPTVSLAPSGSPTKSSAPTSSSAPTNEIFTGDVPASVDFVASLGGQVSAAEVMAGETNQVKIMLEESLLVLAEEVILEEFGSGSTGTFTLRRRATEEQTRKLVVEKATLAMVDSVQDVVCPNTQPVGASNGAALPTDCLNFNNTITLSLVDETDVEGKVKVFEEAMLTKIADGWLVDNFDLQEALQPPPAPSPGTDPDNGDGDSDKLSGGAIAGIVVAGVVAVALAAFFVDREKKRRAQKAEEYDLERQAAVKEGDAASDLGALEGADSSVATEDKSYTSKDALLQGQVTSSAAASALGEMPATDSDVEDSFYSEEDVSGEMDVSPASQVAALAAASTLVTRTEPKSTVMASPYGDDSSSEAPSSAMSEEEEEDFPSAREMGDLGMSPGPSPTKEGGEVGGAAAAVGGAGGAAGAAKEGGIGAGVAAALGAAGAGILAAGAYAATRSQKEDPSVGDPSLGSPSVGTSVDDPSLGASVESGEATGTSSKSPPLLDLDNAIETGNWGQVGALAAVLASQGQGDAQENAQKSRANIATSRSLDEMSGGKGSASRGSSSGQGQSMDQARAVEIDKLVEAGDWQGVVLAAARFEADQTFDEGSFSASASQSSRYTGSATSATTPRSMATTDQSASNLSSQRGQAEIRAEVEALVRRVVPEEADNIDEMMTQFKGREEELVETLRRMQERAIASRARLAVQKSAKLEARAKATPRGSAAAVGSGSSVASGASGSEKSELEQAIESGNWQAVGAAAQKMSDASEDLSADDKARLRRSISQSPAFNRPIISASPDNENVNLDQLIERGDWTGVIAAAKAASGTEVGGVSTEEQDALAQANMWQEIADQSKQEAGQGAAGAGDAAAWAIQRSLQAMKGPGEKARTIDDIDGSGSEASQYESSSFEDSAGRI